MRVLIAGGGVGGLTAALCLAVRDMHVEVFEQAEEFAEIGAGIQLSPNCSRVLHYLGLEDGLREVAFLPEGTQFRHWRTGRVIAENPLGDAVVKRYGAPYYHIHRGDLLRLLLERITQFPNITLHTGARVGGVATEETSVLLNAGGREVGGDVLIGADGIHSSVRGELWGEERPQFTGNVAWRAMVPAERLPAGRIRPMASVWWGPGKHFVHYFVRGGQYVNCVCVVEKTGWQTESWTEPGARGELAADFAGWHEDLQLLIQNANADSLFKWALFDRPPMDAWGQGCISLLGDACHPTLPFMAQGAAMAIEDAAVLAACLDTEADAASALKRYEGLRRARTAGIQRGSRRNARVFHLSGVAAWLRNRAARAAGEQALERLFAYDALQAAD